MKIEIICNEKGTGKTTFAKKKYRPFEYFIFDTIEKYEPISNNMQFKYCIIDSINEISEIFFGEFMNKVFKYNWREIILIFDVPKAELTDCPNFNKLWECGLVPRNYKFTDFTASKNDFYSFLGNYYPELTENLYENIIHLSNNNFQNIDRLMLLKHINSDKSNYISINVLVKYIDEIIRTKFNDIPEADIILQKASIIGEKFVCDALESPNGFGYETCTAYLKQMEEMHGFIRKCMDTNAQYEFITYDIYKGIYQGISSDNKASWVNILIQYYKKQYSYCYDNLLQIQILNKMHSLYKLLPSYTMQQKSVSFLLFYQYQKLGMIYNSLEIANEIANDLAAVINKTEYAFLMNYQIKTFLQIGEYKRVYELLKKIQNIQNYPGSKMLIKYYYAYSLYLIGNIDLSYVTVKEIVNYLKGTSGSNTCSQELFCMTYSLMATVQNHLNKEDGGIRYFKLALNNASSKMNDKNYYYDILRKCDMFYPYDEVKKSLEECLHYYEENHNFDYAGEVYTNLATEMMFQDCSNCEKIKTYFEKALNYFEKYNNEKLAYVKNNFGIYYIMVESNIEKGLKYFHEALIIGLSDFSYMNIYLNICMCYIIKGAIESEAFEDAYIHFEFAKKKLNKRINETKYENIYEKFLKIIIDEYYKKNIEEACKDIINSQNTDNFYIPLVKDILTRNHHNQSDSFYPDNYFFYTKMNQLHCFFAEFRFWE